MASRFRRTENVPCLRGDKSEPGRLNTRVSGCTPINFKIRFEPMNGVYGNRLFAVLSKARILELSLTAVGLEFVSVTIRNPAACRRFRFSGTSGLAGNTCLVEVNGQLVLREYKRKNISNVDVLNSGVCVLGTGQKSRQSTRHSGPGTNNG
jgi:hypothetical protein